MYLVVSKENRKIIKRPLESFKVVRHIKKTNDMLWKLDNLYSSFISKKFIDDLMKLDQYIAKIQTFTDAKLVNNKDIAGRIEEYIGLYSECNILYNKVFGYIHLLAKANTNNQIAQKKLNTIENKEIEIVKANNKFEKWINEIKNLDEVIDGSAYLQEHKFYLKNISREYKYSLDEKDEEMLKMLNEGTKVCIVDYNRFIASKKFIIPFNNENKELNVRSIATNASRGNYKSNPEFQLAVQEITNKCADWLNQIKGERIQVSKARGFKSSLDEVLFENMISPKTFGTMISAVVEGLPVMQRFYKRQAELLEFEDGIRCNSLMHTYFVTDNQITYDRAKGLVLGAFGSYSSNLEGFAKHAIENGWIDAESRNGKIVGSSCKGIYDIKESRINTIYSERLHNVRGLAHEIGHAYHYAQLFKQSFLNYDNSPRLLAEIPSCFCECLFYDHILKEYDDQFKTAVLEQKLNNDCWTIAGGYRNFLFEDNLFKKRENRTLSADEITETEIEAQKSVFGNVDQNNMDSYWWTIATLRYKSHYNNFPYIFGKLLAIGLFAQFKKEEQDFVNKFDKFLGITGKMGIEDSTKTLGINIENIDFWRNAIELLEKDIDQYILLSKK